MFANLTPPQSSPQAEGGSRWLLESSTASVGGG